ncbi:MAG: DNA polymerase III subunit gamma/tau [Thermoguttaceae bacterium]|nr:DNA polymerase III subunit gamma/tau [Thermoguttaceae bacterium]MBR0236572.1 DNA polymerase III subunit gamma/tau [Thermoguttaceae bacterium]
MPDASTDYMVVARRYRPQTFTDVIGQEHVETALTNAINSGRIGHAYLFTGARGVGKTSTARILAKALNCVNGPTTEPCGECESCRAIAAGDDPDVLEIDGASNRGIDEIRALRQGANIRPTRSRFKIYIIDEVHMLTREAFNALLKTLEEPPAHVKFIFCTTEPTKIPITILSRCQRFDFAGIRTDQIAQRLKTIIIKEGATAEEDAVEMLARRAAGSMRDGQSLLEQLLAFAPEHITVADVHSVLGTADEDFTLKIIYNLSQKNALEVLTAFDTAMSQGRDPAIFLEQLCGYFRDLMLILSGGTKNQFLYTSPNNEGLLREAGKMMGIQTVLAALQILDHTLDRMRFTTLGRILAELALTRIAHLADLDSISVMIHRLESGAIAPPVQQSPANRPQQLSAPQVNPNAQRAGQAQGRTLRIPAGFADANIPQELNGSQWQRPAPQQPPQQPPQNRPFVDPNRALGGGLNGVFAQKNAPSAPFVPPVRETPLHLGNRQQMDGGNEANNVSGITHSPSGEPAGSHSEDAPKRPTGADLGNRAEAWTGSGATPPHSSPLTPNSINAENLKEELDSILESYLEGLALDNARSYCSVKLVGPNAIEIAYDWEHSFGYRSWDNPENYTKLQNAVNRHFGQNVVIELKQLPNANPGPTQEERRRAQSKFIGEIAARPAVKEIMRLFKTDIKSAFPEAYPLPDEFKKQEESSSDETGQDVSTVPIEEDSDD